MTDIAFVSVVDSTLATWAHNITESGGGLVVGVAHNVKDAYPGSVTFNGVAMTLIGEVSGNNFMAISLYYMGNPPTGSHNVVVSSNFRIGVSAFYSAVKASGQPEASGSIYTDGGTATADVTMANSNRAWLVAFGGDYYQTDPRGENSTATMRGTVQDVSGTGEFRVAMFDSNGALNAGNHTATIHGKDFNPGAPGDAYGSVVIVAMSLASLNAGGVPSLLII